MSKKVLPFPAEQVAAECADPTTPPARLNEIFSRGIAHGPSRALAYAALIQNANLPDGCIRTALLRGNEAALFNPALPLIGLSANGLQGDIVTCLGKLVGKLVGCVPRREGLYELRSFFGAVVLLHDWWESELLVRDMIERWDQLIVDHGAWIDAAAAEQVFNEAMFWLPENEIAEGSLLRLVAELRGLPLRRDGNHCPGNVLRSIDKAAELLGHPRPVPAINPLQIALGLVAA